MKNGHKNVDRYIGDEWSMGKIQERQRKREAERLASLERHQPNRIELGLLIGGVIMVILAATNWLA